MRDNMRHGYRGSYRNYDGYNMRGDYEHGYREGYRHGYEDSEDDMNEEHYRRSRDSRGRFV